MNARLQKKATSTNSGLAQRSLFYDMICDVKHMLLFENAIKKREMSA